MLNEAQKNFPTVIIGWGKNADGLKDILISLGHQKVSLFKDSKEALDYMKDHETSLIYGAGDIGSMSWLTFTQIIRSEAVYSFCPIIFIRDDFQSFEPGELEKLQKYLFTEIRTPNDDKSVILNEFEKLAFNLSDKTSIQNTLNQAKDYFKKGLIQKANELYKTINDEFTNNITVKVGETECSKFDLEKYNEQLLSLLDKDPENLNIKFNILKNLLTNDNISDFGALFNEIVTDLTNGKEKYWLKQLADICLNAKIPAYSDLILQLIDKNTGASDKWEVHLFEARRALLAGDIDNAKKHAHKALTLTEKGKSEIFNVLGVVKKRQGDLKGAISYFEQAENLSSWDYRISFNIALCYRSLKNNEKAVGILKGILKKNPKYDKAKQMLATLKS